MIVFSFPFHFDSTYTISILNSLSMYSRIIVLSGKTRTRAMSNVFVFHSANKEKVT